MSVISCSSFKCGCKILIMSQATCRAMSPALVLVHGAGMSPDRPTLTVAGQQPRTPAAGETCHCHQSLQSTQRSPDTHQCQEPHKCCCHTVLRSGIRSGSQLLRGSRIPQENERSPPASGHQQQLRSRRGFLLKMDPWHDHPQNAVETGLCQDACPLLW